jgi:hypothetical protein
LQKKTSFTTKARRRGNVAPFPSKTPSKKIYTMFQSKKILKTIYLSSFNIFTYPLTLIFMTNHEKY